MHFIVDKTFLFIKLLIYYIRRILIIAKAVPLYAVYLNTLTKPKAAYWLVVRTRALTEGCKCGLYIVPNVGVDCALAKQSGSHRFIDAIMPEYAYDKRMQLMPSSI